MIRLTLLSLFCAFLCVYAWRDWFKALCGLIVMMAVVEHPDMPNSLLGVQGLNPWNICCCSYWCSMGFGAQARGPAVGHARWH